MRCETVREALSARIDGEAGPVPSDAVDRHVDGCPDCRSRYARMQELHRTMILRPAPRVPDQTAAIMARLPAQRRSHRAVRAALAVVAVVQIGMAVSQLFGSHPGMGPDSGVFMMGHMSHESAAWNLAVGIGLAWAALRTRAATAQLPMLSAFAGTLTVVSLLDLTQDQVTITRLLSHIPVLAGVALLYLVHRRVRTDDPHHHRASPTASADRPIRTDPVHGDTTAPFDYQRPTGRHAA